MKTLTERSNERYAIAFPYHFSILNEPKDICLNKLQSIFLNKEKDIICQIINKKDSLGRTLLDLAVNKGYTDLLVEFLKFGGDINCQGKDGNTLLHTAIYSKHPGIIDTLLKYNNLKINMQDNNGETPLHLACYLGKGENAYKLLEAGADYNIENIWGKKAPELIGAYCVPESDFKEFNSLLSQKEALTEKEVEDQKSEKTSLEKVGQNLKTTFFKKEDNELEVDNELKENNNLIKFADNFPYHFSILNDAKDICLSNLQSIFLNDKKDIICQIINKKDFLGRTLLDIAVNKGYTDLLVEFLKFGGDINCQDKDGKTLLHTAMYSKHPEIIDTLLKYNNLKINMQDDIGGNTPLHLACYLGKGENAYKLLEAGADYNIENIWGKKAPELIGAYCVPESDFKEFNSLLSQKEALTEKGAQDCELEKTPLEKLEQNPKSAILKEEYNGPTNLASATLSLNSGENLPLIGNNEFLSKPEDYDITASLYNSSYIE